jgi:trk system potassium uptake protein
MKRFAVIGLGNFGSHITDALYQDNNEVIAIDINKNKVQAIDSHATQAIVMDATNKEALEHLALDTLDAVIVATGENTSMSILICLHLQEIGVKHIIAKAQNEDHGKILRRVGATEVIHPEREMAVRVAQNLSRPNILDFIPLSRDFSLIQMVTPVSFVGKSLRDLNFRAKYNVHVIAIQEMSSKKTILVPDATFPLKKGDTLIMLGKQKDIERIKGLK